MRVTNLFRKLIGVTSLFFVTGVSFGPRDLVLLVRPGRAKLRCGRPGGRTPSCDRRRLCYSRHLALGRFRLWLAYAPGRVACPGCGVTTEEVPWASSVIRFTWEFEEMTAYLAEITDRTNVTKMKMMGIVRRRVAVPARSELCAPIPSVEPLPFPAVNGYRTFSGDSSAERAPEDFAAIARKTLESLR